MIKIGCGKQCTHSDFCGTEIASGKFVITNFQTKWNAALHSFRIVSSEISGRKFPEFVLIFPEISGNLL